LNNRTPSRAAGKKKEEIKSGKRSVENICESSKKNGRKKGENREALAASKDRHRSVEMELPKKGGGIFNLIIFGGEISGAGKGLYLNFRESCYREGHLSVLKQRESMMFTPVKKKGDTREQFVSTQRGKDVN